MMNVLYLPECMRYTLSLRGDNSQTFAEAGLRIFERSAYNPKTIFSAIGKGGYVLPVMRGRYLGADSVELSYCAILSVNNVKKEIRIYNPTKNEEQTDDLETFLASWTESGAHCITAFTQSSHTYNPKRLDLSSVSIPQDLCELTELLAGHVHDEWAVERQSEGWTYGAERNDRKLETPDMLPYELLPETEKQYDRIMAQRTIKYLLASGYRIVKE